MLVVDGEGKIPPAFTGGGSRALKGTDGACGEHAGTVGDGAAEAALSAEAAASARREGLVEGTRWSRRRRKATGHEAAHARFLQHLFRSYQRLRPGAWGKRSGLAGVVMPWRPVTGFLCKGWRSLAPVEAWARQRALAEEILNFY